MGSRVQHILSLKSSSGMTYSREPDAERNGGVDAEVDEQRIHDCRLNNVGPEVAGDIST